jgi:hypothetical protein
MANTGRTGADAMFRWIHNSVHTLARYNNKIRVAVSLAQAAGILLPAEAATIIGFFDGLSALDAALKKLADYSGFEHES